MKRNLERYAKEGERHKTARYDLDVDELTALMEKALSSQEGAFTAITTAFNAGYEAGFRQGKKEGGK